MIWFFGRDDRHIGVRIRRDPDDAGYELVTSRPDGSEQVVAVESASALIGCALELQAGLLGEGWKPRIVLPPQCPPAPRCAALVLRRGPSGCFSVEASN